MQQPPVPGSGIRYLSTGHRPRTIHYASSGQRVADSDMLPLHCLDHFPHTPGSSIRCLSTGHGIAHA
eukprot:919641-Rhodomonas_salina.2